MRFDEDTTVFLIVIFVMPVLMIGALLFDSHQTKVSFEKTYAINMQCRESMKSTTSQRVNEICGKIPEYEDFLK